MTEANSTKIDALVAAYLKLICLMRNKGDARLVSFADAATKSLEQLSEMRTAQVDAKTTRAMISGLKQGLREMPKLLSSFYPENYLQLVREFEESLGQKFTDF